MSDEIMVFYGGEVPGILTRLRNAKRNADQISILAKSVAAVTDEKKARYSGERP